jgi:hypothetical protein
MFGKRIRMQILLRIPLPNIPLPYFSAQSIFLPAFPIIQKHEILPNEPKLLG